MDKMKEIEEIIKKSILFNNANDVYYPGEKERLSNLHAGYLAIAIHEHYEDKIKEAVAHQELEDFTRYRKRLEPQQVTQEDKKELPIVLESKTWDLMKGGDDGS